MNELQQIMRGLDEDEVYLAVGKKHAKAREAYSTQHLTVSDYSDFEREIADYYAYHFSACVAPGAKLPAFEAKQRAKELLTEEYRREGLTLNNACADAMSGKNGGLFRILTRIADALQHESEYRYAEQLFDTYVEAHGFEGKVEIIRQILVEFSTTLPRTATSQRPEALANEYKQLIRGFVDAKRHAAKVTRR